MTSIVTREAAAKEEKKSLMQRFAEGSVFNGVILLAIIVNMIVIFLDRYPEPQAYQTRLELINNVLFGIFVLEMLLKLIGYGPRAYLRDPYNIFDIFVILLSTVEICLNYAANIPSGKKLLLLFRALRFLRILKIARRWKSFNLILQQLQKSMKEMLNFFVLLFVLLFIYALLGMELYANQVKFDSDNKPLDCDLNRCLGTGDSLRTNFDSFDSALVSVFVLVIGDDWNRLMADYVRATSNVSILFFISLTVIGNIVLLNLLLAILIKHFEEKNASKAFEDSEYKLLWDKISLTSVKLMKSLRWNLVDKWQPPSTDSRVYEG
jgi:hypothetical protein